MYRRPLPRTYYQPINDGERLWIPLLAGAAIISAPFWIGLGRNNNCTNCQPYYQQYAQPYYQPVPYYQPLPYYQPIPPYYQSVTPTVTETNNYY